jgi:hypothetical protein
MMATVEDIKIYAINALTAGVTSLTQLETGLKIILLIVTIGYTLSRWWEIKERRKKNKK